MVVCGRSCPASGVVGASVGTFPIPTPPYTNKFGLPIPYQQCPSQSLNTGTSSLAKSSPTFQKAAASSCTSSQQVPSCGVVRTYMAESKKPSRAARQQLRSVAGGATFEQVGRCGAEAGMGDHGDGRAAGGDRDDLAPAAGLIALTARPAGHGEPEQRNEYSGQHGHLCKIRDALSEAGVE